MNRKIALAVLLAAATGSGFAQDKVLRVVPHSNLSILDPIWTTQYMARNHGYMIYDTLFGTDEKSRVQPQMVDKWTVRPDQRLWTFTLRDGLEFHDGKPVTGEDVAASIARWGKRDAMGQKLMSFVERMDSPDAKTFRIFLREACGFVLEALGKPSSNVPFIMPKRIAETDAFKQIEEHIGSGPYMFKKDEFKPGDKAVYVKNPKYVPRSERAGKSEPQRAYLLFSQPTSPSPPPPSGPEKPGFYVGGNIYRDWATVPARYKAEDPNLPDARRSTASIFRITW